MDKNIKEMICIVCPNGCRMTASAAGTDEIQVNGNGCVRGKEFAINEMTNPVRSLSSTVRTDSEELPVLPVRLSAEIPKDRIFDMMDEINKIRVTGPVKPGAVLARNLLGLGADLIATAGTPTKAGK
ncbi:MAG: DUF1667 domain-containing protein [Anaerovoracaceae bacterium]